jgi:RHS repeat-associated protein
LRGAGNLWGAIDSHRSGWPCLISSTQSQVRGERYVYDGDHIALKFDDAGSLTNRFLHGPLVDQVFADENALGEVLWMLADNQGTVRDVAAYDEVLDETTVVNHLTYDSFGRITGQTNASYEPHFGYTGREWDADAGLWYYRARWYDADVGRFVSEDPLGFAAGDANLSRYVFNSPTNATDPTGLECFAGGPYGSMGGYWAMPQTGGGGSWLDNYSNWFNNTFGGGWSQTVGGGIYDGLVGSGLMTDETLANASDGALLAGTAVTATIIVVGGYYAVPAALGGLNTATMAGYAYATAYAPTAIAFIQSPLGWGTMAALGVGYFSDWDPYYMGAAFITGVTLNPALYAPSSSSKPSAPSVGGSQPPLTGGAKPPSGAIGPKPPSGWSRPSAPSTNPNSPGSGGGWSSPHDYDGPPLPPHWR